MPLKIYAIIVTYNAEKWIESCLNSLKNCELIDTIIVVDNHSQDDTVKIISDQYPAVQLVKMSHNSGFGKANNVGLRIAVKDKADYVFLLNQDARINPGTLEKLVAAHKSEPAYGIISPIHLNGKGNKFDFNFTSYLSEDFIFDLFMEKFRDRANPYPVKFINAAAWLISKDCLKIVGGFDPLFHMYGEDADYVNRVEFHGFKTGIVPGAIIYHDRNSIKKTSLKKHVRTMTTDSRVFLKNINHSIYIACVNSYGYSAKKMFLGLITFKGKDLLAGIISFFANFIMFPKIYLHRKYSMNSGTPFLKDE